MRYIVPVTMALTAVLPGCGTIVRGFEQEVSVRTTPPGALVQFSNGQNCESPCSITAKRDQALRVTVSKEGCDTQVATMNPVVAELGRIQGGFMGAATGASKELSPNPLVVTLTCKGPGSQ